MFYYRFEREVDYGMYDVFTLTHKDSYNDEQIKIHYDLAIEEVRRLKRWFKTKDIAQYMVDNYGYSDLKYQATFRYREYDC